MRPFPPLAAATSLVVKGGKAVTVSGPCKSLKSLYLQFVPRCKWHVTLAVERQLQITKCNDNSVGLVQNSALFNGVFCTRVAAKDGDGGAERD